MRVIRVERSPEEAARSGESGGLEIRLQSPASARAYLEATHPSFAPAILATTLPVRGVRVDVGDVVLAPGTRLTGRVIDDHRVPVPGAIVHWSHAFSATWPNPLLGDAPPLRGDVRADEEGLFALDALPPGVLYLRASQGASSTWIASPSVRLDPDLGTQAVEIVLVPSTPQVLHLASEAGEAVGAATFTEELPVHGVSVPFDAEPTGEPGAWRLRFGASHMSRIGVRTPGFAPTFVTFLPGAEAEVRITLRRGTDGVRIVLPGAVAGARIRVGLVNGAKTPLTVPRMSPDVVGEQALLWRAPPYGIDPRRRVLVLAEGSDTAWLTRDLDAADAAEDAPPVVAERVPISRCRVACVALESGSPVAGAVVRTTRDPSSPGATLSSPWGATCLTPSGAVTLDEQVAGADGTVVIGLLPGISYAVTARADGYGPTRVVVRGEVPRDLALRLARAATVRVRTDAPSVPETVQIATWPGLEVRADARFVDGAAELGALDSGDFIVGPRSVLAWILTFPLSDRGAFLALPVVSLVHVESQPVEVRLASAIGCTVHGTLEPRESREGLRTVDVVPEPLRDSEGPTAMAFPVQPDGTFALGPIPAGRYVLRPFGSTRTPLAKFPVTLRAGTVNRPVLSSEWATLRVGLAGAQAASLVSAQGDAVSPTSTENGVAFFAVPPGPCRLQWLDGSALVVREEPITLRGGERSSK